VGPGGWDGAGRDVVCWAESGCKLKGLCRLGVKNVRCVSFSGENRGGVAKEREGGGEKDENSGEKCDFAGEFFFAYLPDLTRSISIYQIFCFVLHEPAFIILAYASWFVLPPPASSRIIPFDIPFVSELVSTILFFLPRDCRAVLASIRFLLVLPYLNVSFFPCSS
jgi:hypothetical protein